MTEQEFHIHPGLFIADPLLSQGCIAGDDSLLGGNVQLLLVSGAAAGILLLGRNAWS